MWYCVLLIPLLIVLGACSGKKPAAPQGAAAVNPVIEQRIQEHVAEGKAAGYPDLRNMRSDVPPVPSASQRAADLTNLEAQAAQMAAQTAADREPEAGLTPAQRAAALRAAIANDRALAKAEGSLADKLNP